MIELLEAKKRYVPNNGDVDIYGLSPWLEKLEDGRLWRAPNVFVLDFVSLNGWEALELMNIDFMKLFEAAQYECPFTCRVYCAVIPLYILTDDIKKYIEFVPEWKRRMVVDEDWVQNHIIPSDESDDDDHLTVINICMLGPGYMDGILPTDGDRFFNLNTVRLSNGDDLVVAHHEWVNK